MQYRKKPVVIEAFRFGMDAWPQWARLNPGISQYGGEKRENNWLKITTPEGTLRAEWGDWIIRGIAGELYPCKPDIFAATYEAVAEETGE